MSVQGQYYLTIGGHKFQFDNEDSVKSKLEEREKEVLFFDEHNEWNLFIPEVAEFSFDGAASLFCPSTYLFFSDLNTPRRSEDSKGWAHVAVVVIDIVTFPFRLLSFLPCMIYRSVQDWRFYRALLAEKPQASQGEESVQFDWSFYNKHILSVEESISDSKDKSRILHRIGTLS